MTPGARVAAAIVVLNDVINGLAAEQALTRWGRRSRFAGSKDRAAVRDHVFDVMRCRRTAAHYGQGQSGRALMIGVLHQQNADIDALFNAVGHAPGPLNDSELAFPTVPEDRAVQLNLPDWILPVFDASLGDAAHDTAMELQARAPITLRVNLARTDPTAAVDMLDRDGVKTVPNTLAKAALTVIEGPRKIRNSQAFIEGYVELQDAASQAVVACLPAGGKVLDFCAGGGGKSLALAMDTDRAVYAHDVDPKRMADLPARAARADARIAMLTTQQIAAETPFDIVLCDAPCSGSGAWRRAAEGKWLLTPERLDALTHIQDQILDEAAQLVAPNGILAFATCSLFEVENEARVAAFLARNAGWKQVHAQRYAVDSQGDGFFTAHLTQELN